MKYPGQKFQPGDLVRFRHSNSRDSLDFSEHHFVCQVVSVSPPAKDEHLRVCETGDTIKYKLRNLYGDYLRAESPQRFIRRAYKYEIRMARKEHQRIADILRAAE